jgi:hypothetical protein
MQHGLHSTDCPDQLPNQHRAAVVVYLRPVSAEPAEIDHRIRCDSLNGTTEGSTLSVETLPGCARADAE